MARIERRNSINRKNKRLFAEESELTRISTLKKRLIRVRIQTRPYSIFHGLGIYFCGYCGKPMDLYTPRAFTEGERIPTLYYACRDKCKHSVPHRTDFVDRIVMQLVQKRVKENLKKPRKTKGYEEILEKFRLIDELQSERMRLLTKMHYASYNRDAVLAEIREVEEKIEKMKDEVASHFGEDFSGSPLLYPLFETPPEELMDLDFMYLREIARIFVYRIRSFNEFLLLRVRPLNPDEMAKDDGMGKIVHINLRSQKRYKTVELPSKEDLKPPEVLEETEPFKDLKIPQDSEEEDIEYL